MCRGCAGEGRLTRANTVDHVVPISEGGSAFPGHDGLASYCPSCHSAKTARGDEAGAIRTAKPRKGCNPDGSPLDPAHPWHGKSLRAGGAGPARNTKTQLDGWRRR
ncbi:HNH endonuclease signature motif containing protein [Xanthobacter sp. NFH-44]